MTKLRLSPSMKGSASTLQKHTTLKWLNTQRLAHAGISDTKEATRSAAQALTETLPYIEIAGHRLALQNHRKPMCQDIALNEEIASHDRPQAWSRQIDNQEHWFYNYPGACAEAAYLGKKIPSPEEWLEILAALEGTITEKAKVLNIPMIDHRDALDNKFEDDNDGVVWAKTDDETKPPECIILKGDGSYAIKYPCGAGNAMGLRFFHSET